MGSGKHLRGLLEQSIYLLLFPHMPSPIFGKLFVHLHIDFFFYVLFSSAISTGLTRVFIWGDKRCHFHHCYHCGSISASCFLLLALDIPRSVHVSGPPFSLYCPHTPFYRPRVAGSIVVSTIAMENISIQPVFCRSV